MNRKKLVRFDWAMKYILRNKANFDVLEGFLSNLLKEDMKIEEILESESNQEEDGKKFNRVDLLCKDTQGRRIIIEIQNNREVDYIQRILWGTSKTIADNLQLGSDYKDVVKVITISVLYFQISQDNEYLYKGQTEITGMHNHKPLLLYDKKLKAVGVEPINSSSIFPEYYLIDVKQFEDIINEEIDEWVYFFKHGEIREDFTSKGILLASQRLDILSMSREERANYERYLGYLASERDMLGTAREEGMLQGKQEEKFDIALKMLAAGSSVEFVSQITGLPVEKVANLRQ